MNKKATWSFILAGFILAAVPALFQSSPGYTDADYYFASALRIANGNGLTDAYLWHYLGNFQRIQHPSFSFWKPLPSLLAASGMVLLGRASYLAARLPFLVGAGFIPLVSAKLTWEITGDQEVSSTAGWLACFSGFYLAFLPVTDTFTPLLLLGGGFFILLSGRGSSSRTFWLGLICGGIHLTRAEGLLWFVLAAAVLWIQKGATRKDFFGLAAGYLIMVGPWMVRNSLVFGSLFGKGGLKTLWLTEYNQLFAYPPELINFQTWWNQGLGEILRERLEALFFNLQTAGVVQGYIFLVPLILWGGWKYRSSPAVKAGGAAWLGMLGIMSGMFPHPGIRGSFFHAGAALQPLFWACAAAGMKEFFAWGAHNRNWELHRAKRVLGTGIILLSAGLSLFLVKTRVIGQDFRDPAWNQPYQNYRTVEKTLMELDPDGRAPVMVNNPPGYYAATRRPAVVVPTGGIEAVLQAAVRYDAGYLLLDENYPPELQGLYDHPEDRSGIRYLDTLERIQVYQFTGVSP